MVGPTADNDDAIYHYLYYLFLLVTLLLILQRLMVLISLLLLLSLILLVETVLLVIVIMPYIRLILFFVPAGYIIAATAKNLVYIFSISF